MREGYDVAQVCPNGHVANDSSQTMPEFSRTFCESCGEPTINMCPACQRPLRGRYHSPGVIAVSPYRPPAYCRDCGKPFPWTERRLEAARELALEQDQLSTEERELLVGSLEDLVRDVPRTQVAATRFKRLMAKAGGGAAGAFRDILVDIASETAKKAIWGS